MRQLQVTHTVNAECHLVSATDLAFGTACVIQANIDTRERHGNRRRPELHRLRPRAAAGNPRARRLRRHRARRRHLLRSPHVHGCTIRRGDRHCLRGGVRRPRGPRRRPTRGAGAAGAAAQRAHRHADADQRGAAPAAGADPRHALDGARRQGGARVSLAAPARGHGGAGVCPSLGAGSGTASGSARLLQGPPVGQRLPFTLASSLLGASGGCTGFVGTQVLHPEFVVRATPAPACTVTATDLAFPSSGLLASSLLAQSSLTVVCTATTAYSVSLDNGR
ncbi:MAG: hypothetical protein EOO24_05695 [Comamonadaceae bacterium]|nr:MAG: hypothetical protein EOO24_05695 [Comamonadaceae bacterium]